MNPDQDRAAWRKVSAIARLTGEVWSWSLMAKAVAVVLGEDPHNPDVTDRIHANCREWARREPPV